MPRMLNLWRNVQPAHLAKRGPAMSRRMAMAALAASTVAGATAYSVAAPPREAWVAVQDVSLIVPEGSALDFSALSPPGPAGRFGRVVASPDGRLAFESEPHTPVRLNCASLAWSPASGSFPDKATADLYAAQLRIHGYNLARFHEVEAILMTDRMYDFDYDPEQLDRFHYLLAALKREGIYWMFDIMTSQNGAIGKVRPHRWVDRHRLKLRVHVEEEARHHWRRIAETIYARPNPYTGIAPLHDPALALVILVNENGLQFTAFLDTRHTQRAYSPLLKPKFNAWLKARYGDTEALRRAWGPSLVGGSLEKGTVELAQNWRERGPRMRDMKRFFRELEAETLSWMEREIRSLGYPGLVSMYNNWLSSETHSARGLLSAITLNTYFDEVGSYETSVTITQNSSLDDGLRYIRSVAAARWLGRPFVISEYSQPFWNAFRREAGLVFPAYAALQGWDSICRHSHGAIDLTYQQPWPHKRRMMPYTAGLDPVQRAGETLAALLFHRGDVAAAPTTAAIPYGDEMALRDDGLGMFPDAQTVAALFVRIGLAPPDSPSIRSGKVIALQQHSAAEQPATDWQRVVASLLPQSETGALNVVDMLRGAGAIPAHSRTAIEAGLFESETGELLIDTARRFARVVTPRTEAASFARFDEAERLGVMTVIAASGPALVAASVLDGQPLDRSNRILIIVATDALNTDMRFRDANRRTIEDYGRLPVRVKRESVELALAFASERRATLRSLRLDGTPGDRIPIRMNGAQISMSIDNAAPSHGPTTYFLLERENGEDSTRSSAGKEGVNGQENGSRVASASRQQSGVDASDPPQKKSKQ